MKIDIVKMGNEQNDTIVWSGGYCFICKKYPAEESHHLIPKVLNNSFNEFIGICSRCQGLIHNFARKNNHRELTLIGLKRAKENGKVLGRPLGSKDKKPRPKIGYWKRWTKNKR